MCDRTTAIAHVHDPDLLFASAIPILLGKRVIYDVHEFYRERLLESEWIPAFLRRLAHVVYDSAERLLLPHAAGVVVTTPEMYDAYRSIARRSRLALVRNYPAFDDGTVESARQSTRPLQRKYVLQTGGGSTTHPFDVQIATAERLRKSFPDIAFVIAGRIDLNGYHPSERSSLMQRANAAGILPLGYIDHKDLLRWIAHAEIGYAPYSDTANERRLIPTKIFEYFAFGIPVIVSDVGFSATLVQSTQSGLAAAANDPEAHAEAMSRILADTAFRERCARHSQIASRTYSFVKELPALLGLYERIGSIRPNPYQSPKE